MTDNNTPIPEPQLEDMMDALKRDIFRTMHCMLLGEIVSFDSASGTARVKVLFKRVLPDGSTKSRSPLLNVPVVVMQGGGGRLQFPIQAGDQCVLLFADRNIDKWLKDGLEAAPPNDRCHDISDAIAIVGINSLASSLPAAIGTMLSFGGAFILLKDGLVTIQNEAIDLLTLMTTLLTTMAALKTTTNLTLHADSIAAIAAVQVQFESLLGVPV